MLLAYTCSRQMSKEPAYKFGGQMSKGRAYTLFAYTCSEPMSWRCPYILFAYTCSGPMS